MLKLACTLVAAGLIGGAMSYYLNPTTTGTPPEGPNPRSFWSVVAKHLVLGLGAALMVPLLLHILSSGLLDDVLDGDTEAKPEQALAIIGGFAILASASSQKFISAMTNKVLGMVQAAEADAKYARELVGQFVEPEDAEDATPTRESAPEATDANLKDYERAVVSALRDSPYLASSTTSLARASGLEGRALRATLDALEEGGLAARIVTPDGNVRWMLTARGRRLS